MITAAVMMLRHIGERVAAGRIESALEKSACAKRLSGAGLGGSPTDMKFTQAILREIDT